MNDLSKNEKVANVIAFLSILFGEDEQMNAVMNFSPDHIIEKFERYVLSSRTEYQLGLHPLLRSKIFEQYMHKWGVLLKDE
jgi:hypothetical protein